MGETRSNVTLLTIFFTECYVFISIIPKTQNLKSIFLTLFLSQFLLTFQQPQHEMPHFIAYLMTILLLIGMVFMII